MYLYITTPRKLAEASVEGIDLKAWRKAERLTTREAALRLGLVNGSSLYQYESGSKRLSRAVRRRFMREAKGMVFNAIVFSFDGETLPERICLQARVKACECGCNQFFLSTNRAKRFIDRSHQLRARRRK